MPTDPAASPPTAPAPPSAASDGYEALGDDIRLLGRLLGDVVREQAGDDTFDLIESVRRVAVTARRNGTSSVAELEALLGPQPIDRVLNVIRAFDWLSLLANTAEDLHVERRRRHHLSVGSGAQRGSLAATFDELLADGVAPETIVDVLADLEVSPVITAHPTEVRRKTILDVLGDVGDLLDRPRPPRATAIGAAPTSSANSRHASSRSGRPPSCDCRSSASATRSTKRSATTRSACSRPFPACTADLETLADERLGAAPADTSRAVNMGSWIGGDRDGNPFVTADVMRLAIGRQATIALAAPPRRDPPAVDRTVDVVTARHPDRGAPPSRRRLG